MTALSAAKRACAPVFAVVAICLGALSASAAQPAASGPILQVPSLHEASGLARSQCSSDVLWVHNDSGNPPVLFAVGVDGSLKGSLRPKGAKNIDWEDIDSFSLGGKPYLLIADVGDNSGVRKVVTLYIVVEPSPDALSPSSTTSVPVERRIDFVYPNGPHDCEAVAVDVRERRIYLLTKRTHPPELFTLPLDPPDDRTLMATAAGTVTHLPQPTQEQRLLPTPTGRYRGQPTGMNFSPDGKLAVVLTYGDVLLFRRQPGQDWAQALAGEPEIVGSPSLPQAEGVVISADGSKIFVTGEQKNPPLLTFRVQENP